MTSPNSRLDASAVTLHRDGHGPPLVLLHCLGVDHRFWDFAAPLGRDFTLLRYDLPGHGASAVPAGPYGIEHLSAQLAAVLAANQVARAHVAGISLGGLIAQHLAASRPELVDRLILIDTTPRYIDELRHMWDAARRDRARGRRRADDCRAARHLVLGRRARARRRRRALRARDAGALPGRGLRARLRGAEAADLRALAPRIAARTLVVCGDDDIPSFLEAARWLAATIPTAELAWIKGAKHASVLENPDEARRLMRTFLLRG